MTTDTFLVFFPPPRGIFIFGSFGNETKEDLRDESESFELSPASGMVGDNPLTCLESGPDERVEDDDNGLESE